MRITVLQLDPISPLQSFVESHHDAVVSLPPGAQLLGSSTHCPIQAMRLDPIVSVQFYPECAPDVAGQWAACSNYDATTVAQNLSRHVDRLTHTGDTLATGSVHATQVWR